MLRLRIAIATAAVAPVLGAGAIGATPALADNCHGTTVASLRTCVNVRMNNQYAAIQKLQRRVSALESSTTVAGLSSRVATLEQRADALSSRITAAESNDAAASARLDRHDARLDALEARNAAMRQCLSEVGYGRYTTRYAFDREGNGYYTGTFFGPIWDTWNGDAVSYFLRDTCESGVFDR